MKKPMKMNGFEKSAVDKKMDKRLKEGSKADMAADRKGLAKMNAKRGKK